VSSIESNISTLCNTDALISVVKGGGDDNDVTTPQRKTTTSDFTQTPNIGFQPIPGLISPTPMMGGMMSPPPMLMPTPIPGGQLSMLGAGGYPSLTSPMMMGGPGMNVSSASEIQPAMAFTYVPVPVYNMTSMGMGMNPQMGMMSPNTTIPAPSAGEANRGQPQGTSTPLAAGIAGQQNNDSIQNMNAAQMSYQQAFLQNAVAQNMQIQQQLMMQNQALSQLLSQSGNAGGGSGNNSWTSGGPSSSMTTMMGTPMASVLPAAMSTPMNMNLAMNMNAQVAAQTKASQHQEPSNLAYYSSDALRRASIDHLDEVKTDKDLVEMKQRSMSTPNTPKQSGLSVPPQAPMMPPGNKYSYFVVVK
jgi:hypothetical protein